MQHYCGSACACTSLTTSFRGSLCSFAPTSSTVHSKRHSSHIFRSDASPNPTRLHLRSYAPTCCEQTGGGGAERANAEEREMERRRGKLRSSAGLSCASTRKFRRGQARTLAALKLTTVYCEDEGGRTKCIKSSTLKQMV